MFRVLRDLALGRTFARESEQDDSLEVLRGGTLLCLIQVGDDGLPTTLVVPGPTGEPNLETLFTDWRRVDGLALPAGIEQPLYRRRFRWDTFEPNVDLAGVRFALGE